MGYHSLLWELNSQSQFYWEGDPLSSAWQSLQQKNGAYLPVHPGDMTTHVHSAKGFSQLHLGTQHTGPLQNQEKKKKKQRLRSQPIYWSRKRVLLAEITVLFFGRLLLLLFWGGAPSEVLVCFYNQCCIWHFDFHFPSWCSWRTM